MYCRNNYWSCCNSCSTCNSCNPCTTLCCIGPTGPTGATGIVPVSAFGGLVADSLLTFVVPASVITEIPLNVQMENENTTYVGSAIEVIEPGIYQIQTNLRILSAVASFGASFSIGLNGVEIPITYTNLIITNVSQQFIVNIFYELEAGDLVNVVVNSVTSGTINFDLGHDGTLTINKVN